MTTKAVYTTFEAAKMCHVSPLSIINWVNAGRLSAFRTPGGHRRIRREDLLRFMQENGLPIPEELRTASGRLKILIVDDESSVREVLAEHFAKTKLYDVMTASDGFEAGRLVGTFRPDVLLLDLRMPGLDGFQVCRTIKADASTSNTSVIAVTGYYSPETEARIIECGAIRCFAKPVEPSTLISFVNSLAEQRTTPKGGKRRRPARA